MLRYKVVRGARVNQGCKAFLIDSDAKFQQLMLADDPKVTDTLPNIIATLPLQLSTLPRDNDLLIAPDRRFLASWKDNHA